ncbi:MAG: hypothetical protein K2W85_14325 [Phycisphaerales bacterium]|nr:hypothetical protein [Phycisphaerales bacterium]
MDRSKRIAFLVMLASAAVFAAAMAPMTNRIQEFNAGAKFLHVHFEPIVSRKIAVEGFPEGTLIDTDKGIELAYGGKTTLIPVKLPPAKGLPNLAGYDEWLKVLACFQVDRDGENKQIRRDGSERLMIVVRRTPEGLDPEAWGQVRRIDWVFDYYDLGKDGQVTHTIKRWPRKYRSENRLQAEAKGERPDCTKEQIEAAKALAAIAPISERTVEYAAAMHVIPKLNVPEHKFTDTAFSPAVLGWTLPASMFAILGVAGGLVFTLAPRRSPVAGRKSGGRGTPGQTPSPARA